MKKEMVLLIIQDEESYFFDYLLLNEKVSYFAL